MRVRLSRECVVGALLAYGLCGVCLAQAQSAPTLDTVLAKLEANLQHYDAQVPSFLADEHVVSQVTPGPANQNIITESTFRLKRVIGAKGAPTLVESRDVHTVNGHTATADELKGPSILSGAFSGGLAIVSLGQKGCMDYTLRPIKPNHPKDPYVVEFTSTYNRAPSSVCLLREDGSGHIEIDPMTMQITHMELKAPHHLITPEQPAYDGGHTAAVYGGWKISLDYKPVRLGVQTFWMPSTINSGMSAVSLGGATAWSFKARYSNYHKLEVTTRIVPAGS